MARYRDAEGAVVEAARVPYSVEVPPVHRDFERWLDSREPGPEPARWSGDFLVVPTAEGLKDAAPGDWLVAAEGGLFIHLNRADFTRRYERTED